MRRQWSWGHRWSNTEPLDLRLERKLGWNEGAGRVPGWAASGLDSAGGAGDGEKLLDVAGPGHCACLGPFRYAFFKFRCQVNI